jgi:hypothetical protein
MECLCEIEAAQSLFSKHWAGLSIESTQTQSLKPIQAFLNSAENEV